MNKAFGFFKRHSESLVLGAAGVAVAAAVFSVVMLIPTKEPVYAKDEVATNVSFTQLQALQASFRDVAQKILPTVVEVNTVNIVTQRVPDVGNLFRFFGSPFGQQNDQNDQGNSQERQYRQKGLGSGVIVRKTGRTVYVLTNAHVVSGADEIRVSLYDGRDFDVKLVGMDDRRDLALVSFETSESVPIAQMGDSDSLMPGDWVLAVGNPLGFESTVTAGIVSALGRQSNAAGFTDFIQTDAAINQGNSGGALVNIYGEVIGINSWIASQTGGSIGLGFAIPINNAKSAIDDFIQGGQIQYGWLGVGMGIVPEEFLGDIKQDTGGAFIANIFRDSPADKGGILPGDVIVSVDGKTIKSRSDLLLAVSGVRPGNRIDVGVMRNGRRINLSIAISARKDDDSLSRDTEWPGLVLVPVTDEVKNQMNLPAKAGNVVVADVDATSPAAKAGVQAWDIIQKIDGKNVKSVSDFYEIMNGSRNRKIELRLLRKNEEITVELSK